MGQFVHLLRRNAKMLYVVENNGVYGLTKGQFSATADRNSPSKRGAHPTEESIDLCGLALELGVAFLGEAEIAGQLGDLPVQGGQFQVLHRHRP